MTPKLTVVIVVPHYWGKGETLTAAWKRVAKEAGKSQRELKRGAYKVHVVPESDEFEAYVDAHSSLHWADVEGMRNLIIDENDPNRS